jgi:hypothetical protein
VLLPLCEHSVHDSLLGPVGLDHVGVVLGKHAAAGQAAQRACRQGERGLRAAAAFTLWMLAMGSR